MEHPGLRVKFEELLEIKESRPAVMCLQETMVGTCSPTMKGYRAFSYSPTQVPIAGTGILTLVRDDISCYQVPLVTEFQARAVRVKLRKEVTVCNVYVNQDQALTRTNLGTLFDQLPKPFLVLGDFNSKSPL